MKDCKVKGSKLNDCKEKDCKLEMYKKLNSSSPTSGPIFECHSNSGLKFPVFRQKYGHLSGTELAQISHKPDHRVQYSNGLLTSTMV